MRSQRGIGIGAMMDKTPCRGLHQISCKAETCQKEKQRIEPACINCEQAEIDILDLQDKAIVSGAGKPKEAKNKK